MRGGGGGDGGEGMARIIDKPMQNLWNALNTRSEGTHLANAAS